LALEKGIRNERAAIEVFVSEFLGPLFSVGKGIRLLGVTLSSLAAGTEAGVEHQRLLPI
jgi:hypothetical protein